MSQRRASPSPVGHRRLNSSVPAAYDVPVREPRTTSAETARRLRFVVAAAWGLGFAGSALSFFALDTPEWLLRPSAALLTLALTVSLTHRGGGHLRLWLPLVAVLTVAAVVTELPFLLSASAAVTAVLGAVWAVVVTRPAGTVFEVVREYVIALTVAASGGAGVAAWNARVDVDTFTVVVIAASFALTISLVWGLGAGLHGLGRLHLAGLAGVGAVLVLLIAYSGFVRDHGSDWLTDGIDDIVFWMRTHLEGVPRPVEMFAGFPALVVGVAMRSQRREGWWVQVFAVLGTATMTVALVSPSAYPTYITVSTAYSAIFGLIIGLIVRHFVLAPPSRSSRVIQPTLRTEPERLSPLK